MPWFYDNIIRVGKKVSGTGAEHHTTSNDVQTLKASGYHYANAPDWLRDRNAHMKIWPRVNCFDLCKSSYFTYMKNMSDVIRRVMS